MRVSPVGWARDTLEAVWAEAARSAAVSHNHPEGIKGAQAVATAVFLARTRSTKRAIRDTLSAAYGYDLARPLKAIRPHYRFDVSSQGSVPESIIAFLESDDYESAVRNAVSLGGDSDTMACIAGAIAEAFYGEIPLSIAQRALSLLPPDLRLIVEEFCAGHGRGITRPVAE